jgi:hypothetical protein
MYLEEAKKRALGLMAEFSVDGTPISEYENMDYLNRMNRFAYDAIVEIANECPIEASEVYTLEKQGDSVKYHKLDLPSDFKDLNFINFEDEVFTGTYRIVKRQLWLQATYEGTLELFYFKHPTLLTDETEDSHEFEVEQQYHALIPYYMGGMAIGDENPVIGDKLMNMFYSKLENTKQTHTDDQQKIDTIFFI